MVKVKQSADLFSDYIVPGNHQESDYFSLIRELLIRKNEKGGDWSPHLEKVYNLLYNEIKYNQKKPTQEVSFGTSGWRGKLGKDIYVKSVVQVTQAIVDLYTSLSDNKELEGQLGVGSLEDAQQRGGVVGFDNRFGGELLALQVVKVLVEAGFNVQYAGESTTGVLSAAVLRCNSAFSINLTPSHNPLEYGGYKFNAADAGPAAAVVTKKITANARKIIAADDFDDTPEIWTLDDLKSLPLVKQIDSLALWKELVSKNKDIHGLDLEKAVAQFVSQDDLVIAIDCVHGASRLHIRDIFNNCHSERLKLLRDDADVTFNGVAPEPSSKNMSVVTRYLAGRSESLKIGAIIDPDGDRIRFTDGTTEISMNQFGAMAYHFLHQMKGKTGMVAKTVATSNLANSVAKKLSENLFEPSVGFKNFKPIIGEAVVIFEESDGISIIGHTPEKDAYIGLLLALEMVLTTNMNLGDYLQKIEEDYGQFFPDRDGIVVQIQGKALQEKLGYLKKYAVGTHVEIGSNSLKIIEVIAKDGCKLILEDGSWLMIRPSGTEPKVRFYVESRTQEGTVDLVTTAKKMLQEIGVI